MLNYSSNCNQYYQVDFIFFLLDVLHYFKKNLSRRGIYLISWGASSTLPSKKSFKSATREGWIRIKTSHKQGILHSYHNSEKYRANQNKESQITTEVGNASILLSHFSFYLRIPVNTQKQRLV